MLTHPFLTRRIEERMIGIINRDMGCGDYTESENDIIGLTNNKNTTSISVLNSIDDNDYPSKTEETFIEKFTDYPKDSRLNTEFQVLGKVGSGAFGVVLKVKNRIDSCTYAIKRIRLNPNSCQLNKQITREIKLLSRLNHENVVRYYSTWREKYEVDASETETTETSMDTRKMDAKAKKKLVNKQDNKKKLQKSSSLSNLMMKQSNNMMIQEGLVNNNDDDDDGFSSSCLFGKNLNTVAPLSLSSSSSITPSDSESLLEPSDDASILFHLSDSEDHKPLNMVSPAKKFERKLNKNFRKKNANIDDSISIVFENDGKNTANDLSDEISIKTSPAEKHRVFVFIQVSL